MDPINSGERERERKYESIAADYVEQLPGGWRVFIHLLVIGDLVSVVHFREELEQIGLFPECDIINLLNNCQAEVLSETARILRQALSRG